MTTQEQQAQLKVLKAGIRLDAPLVANFFDTSTPLKDYAPALYEYEALPEHRERQKLLQEKVRQILQRTFSPAELGAARIPWRQDWKINIVDHHGILNHPILIATNIIGNMHQLPTPGPEGIVVISDSGVPMNNFFHKRGLKFKNTQLNIFPHAQRHAIAYAAPKKEAFPLASSESASGFSDEEKQFLADIEQELTETAKTATRYLDQVTRINYLLWKRLFAREIRDAIPDLFYVSNEELAAELLPEYFQDADHLFTNILFDPAVRAAFIKGFDGVTGCWNSEKNIGSVFFWGLNEKGEALSLELKGNTLVSRDDAQPFALELTPEAVTAALKQKTIYPGMFLVYGISIFHCGIRPLVGYGSMNYQTKMRQHWVETIAPFDSDEAGRIASIPTDGFIGGPKTTFAATETGFKDLFALDIIHAGGLTKNYLDHLREMPFNALLTPALIDIYDSYVKAEHKQKITITSGELMSESFGWLQDLR